MQKATEVADMEWQDITKVFAEYEVSNPTKEEYSEFTRTIRVLQTVHGVSLEAAVEHTVQHIKAKRDLFRAL